MSAMTRALAATLALAAVATAGRSHRLVAAVEPRLDEGAPLLGAAESLEDVEKRFGAFASRNVRDMRRVYDALIAAAPDELKRIAALEIFDDPDQFALIMSHYCLVFAASGACVPLVGACSGG